MGGGAGVSPGAGVSAGGRVGAGSVVTPGSALADGAGVVIEGVGESCPTLGSAVPLRRARASRAPATAASEPPTAVKMVAGLRHHGTLAYSMPARTRAPRSRGGL